MAFALPYLLVFFCFAVMAVIYAQRCEFEEDKKLCNSIVILSVGIFYIFFAFRGYVYTDWMTYIDHYANAEWSDIFSIVSAKKSAVIHEPGFTLLMCLCRVFSDKFPFFVMVLTTIDTILFLRFLKRWNVKNVPLVLMLFFMFKGITIMFNLFRNQVAIFIFLNLLEYIEKKQMVKYYIGCLIALCFHSSSALFFPLYFILRFKLNKWIYLGLFLSFFAFYLSQRSIVETIINLLGLEGVLGEKAAAYTEMFSSAREFSISGTIEKVGMFLISFLLYDKLTAKPRNIIVLNCLLIHMFFYYMFAEFQMMSSRLCILFVFSYWLIWVELLDMVPVANNKRLIGGLLFLYCSYSLACAFNEPIQEYDNLLFGAKSPEQRIRIREKTFEEVAN